MSKRHFLTLLDFSRTELQQVLDRAIELNGAKKDASRWRDLRANEKQSAGDDF